MEKVVDKAKHSALLISLIAHGITILAYCKPKLLLSSFPTQLPFRSTLAHQRFCSFLFFLALFVLIRTKNHARFGKPNLLKENWISKNIQTTLFIFTRTRFMKLQFSRLFFFGFFLVTFLGTLTPLSVASAGIVQCGARANPSPC